MATLMKTIDDLIQKEGWVLKRNNRGRYEFSFRKEILDFPIEDAGLNLRSYNAFKRHEVNTIGEALDAINSGQMLSWGNVGITTIKKTKNDLLEWYWQSLSPIDQGKYIMEIFDI